MPVAMISTKTSPAFGPSRSTSTISSGFFASNATAARVFMSSGPLGGRGRFFELLAAFRRRVGGRLADQPDGDARGDEAGHDLIHRRRQPKQYPGDDHQRSDDHSGQHALAGRTLPA